MLWTTTLTGAQCGAPLGSCCCSIPVCLFCIVCFIIERDGEEGMGDRGEDIQQMTTGRIQTLGHCVEDWAYMIPSQPPPPPWRKSLSNVNRARKHCRSMSRATGAQHTCDAAIPSANMHTFWQKDCAFKWFKLYCFLLNELILGSTHTCTTAALLTVGCVPCIS